MSAAESHFSWMRARMSTEQTLISWVRTSVSLIGFGFTIFQFLENFNELEGVSPARHPKAPWVFGMALIASGTLCSAIAFAQYRTFVRYLLQEEYKEIAGERGLWRWTPASLVAVLMIVIGIFTFGAVALRVR